VLAVPGLVNGRARSSPSRNRYRCRKRRSAAPRWPRRWRSEPPRSPAALGERAPGPGRLSRPAPTRRSWLADRTSPATAPSDQLIGTSSVGFSSVTSRAVVQTFWRMSSRALITAPSARSRVEPPLPERLRRGRLDVTGAEPAAHQRRWHRPEMPALKPLACGTGASWPSPDAFRLTGHRPPSS